PCCARHGHPHVAGAPQRGHGKTGRQGLALLAGMGLDRGHGLLHYRNGRKPVHRRALSPSSALHPSVSWQTKRRMRGFSWRVWVVALVILASGMAAALAEPEKRPMTTSPPTP